MTSRPPRASPPTRSPPDDSLDGRSRQPQPRLMRSGPAAARSCSCGGGSARMAAVGSAGSQPRGSGDPPRRGPQEHRRGRYAGPARYLTARRDRPSLLITVSRGARKSYAVGLLAERLIGFGYAAVMIDPEGDHTELGMPHNVLFSAASFPHRTTWPGRPIRHQRRGRPSLPPELDRRATSPHSPNSSNGTAPAPVCRSGHCGERLHRRERPLRHLGLAITAR